MRRFKIVVKFQYLVFGKAVRVRHYPVTVIAKNGTGSLLQPLRVYLGRLFRFVEA
jgi:hypothetical protein